MSSHPSGHAKKKKEASGNGRPSAVQHSYWKVARVLQELVHKFQEIEKSFTGSDLEVKSLEGHIKKWFEDHLRTAFPTNRDLFKAKQPVKSFRHEMEHSVGFYLTIETVDAGRTQVAWTTVIVLKTNRPKIDLN